MGIRLDELAFGTTLLLAYPLCIFADTPLETTLWPIFQWNRIPHHEQIVSDYQDKISDIEAAHNSIFTSIRTGKDPASVRAQLNHDWTETVQDMLLDTRISEENLEGLFNDLATATDNTFEIRHAGTVRDGGATNAGNIDAEDLADAARYRDEALLEMTHETGNKGYFVETLMGKMEAKDTVHATATGLGGAGFGLVGSFLLALGAAGMTGNAGHRKVGVADIKKLVPKPKAIN